MRGPGQLGGKSDYKVLKGGHQLKRLTIKELNKIRVGDLRETIMYFVFLTLMVRC